jgi:hypothetical protein
VLITHNNEHGISSINVVDAQTLITVCGSISRCLFLIVRRLIGSFIAPILGFIGELAPLYQGFENSYPPRDEREHVIRDCEARR